MKKGYVMEYKLKDTTSKDAFNYGYLLKRIYPYIKPVMGRVLLNLLIAVPLGLLDGVMALALKPYMDFVVNGTPDQTWSFLGQTIYIQTFLAAIIPFGIVAFDYNDSRSARAYRDTQTRTFLGRRHDYTTTGNL